MRVLQSGRILTLFSSAEALIEVSLAPLFTNPLAPICGCPKRLRTSPEPYRCQLHFQDSTLLLKVMLLLLLSNRALY